MSAQLTDSVLNQNTTPGSQTHFPQNTTIVGLYGVPGSGKTFLLRGLKQNLGQDHFAFYEGSEMIASVVPGGLGEFQKLEEDEKIHWRKLAIDTVRKESVKSGKVAVVVGHFMFWSEEQEFGTLAYTSKDLDVFTHILYLDVPADTIVQRRLRDAQRSRPPVSVAHLNKWQSEEKTQLRYYCRRHGILFSLIYPHTQLLNKVSTLLHDFKNHTENYNLFRAESYLNEVFADKAFDPGHSQVKTVLVMDADRTLAPEDTGLLFWKRVKELQSLEDGEDTLKSLFNGPLAYSYKAFRQATLLYEETVDDQEFDTICQEVANKVNMYPWFTSLLRLVAQQNHVGAVVVTCGLRRVWEKVLEREGLSEVKVIGGGRIVDGFVVSAEVKGSLVTRLREAYRMYVWAFGDSLLDLDMLSKADQAIVVVGDEQSRSQTMSAALENAIDNHGLQARQILLTKNASPRLDHAKLPVVNLTEPDFVQYILRAHEDLQVLCATDKNAAKLLATPMRDAANAGPHLRNAHRRVGWYLAIEFLTDVIGLENCPIQHVLGSQTNGYQLLHEQKTTIVALMRGGEPMASGVSDAFPLAMFVHANSTADIKLHHLQEQSTLILVDSVINTGKTIVEFVQHVRKLHATIRIVVVAGVVQAECVSGSKTSLNRSLANEALHLVALRISETKFTGTGKIDTGNRLFNTTHLP